MISNVGINEVSNFLSAQYIIVALGISDTPESMSDTKLDNEVIRGSTENSITTTYSINDTATFIRPITNTSSNNLKELGIFDVSNKMFFRSVLNDDAYIPSGQEFNLIINIISKEVD